MGLFIAWIYRRNYRGVMYSSNFAMTLIMMTLVTFGGMTPPVGVSMFTVCGILKCSFKEYTVEMLPFGLAVLAVVAIMILFPELVLFLPNAMMGG